jgi:hypothetical protein
MTPAGRRWASGLRPDDLWPDPRRAGRARKAETNGASRKAPSDARSAQGRQVGAKGGEAMGPDGPRQASVREEDLSLAWAGRRHGPPQLGRGDSARRALEEEMRQQWARGGVRAGRLASTGQARGRAAIARPSTAGAFVDAAPERTRPPLRRRRTTERPPFHSRISPVAVDCAKTGRRPATTGRPTTGRPTTGRPTTGRATGRATTGRATTGRATTGRATGRATTGRATTGRATTGRAATGRATSRRATTGRAATGRATTGRATSGRATSTDAGATARRARITLDDWNEAVAPAQRQDRTERDEPHEVARERPLRNTSSSSRW